MLSSTNFTWSILEYFVPNVLSRPKNTIAFSPNAIINYSNIYEFCQALSLIFSTKVTWKKLRGCIGIKFMSFRSKSTGMGISKVREIYCNAVDNSHCKWKPLSKDAEYGVPTWNSQSLLYSFVRGGKPFFDITH